MRTVAQCLDEVVPVNGPELHVLHVVVPGDLARHLIRRVEMSPVVNVHSQLDHSLLLVNNLKDGLREKRNNHLRLVESTRSAPSLQ